MLKKLLQRILLSVALICGLLCSVVSAKDFGLFSLDYDNKVWAEVVREYPNELGINNVVLVNVQDQSMVSIMTQDLGTTVTNEELEARCKIVLDYYKQNGLMVNEANFNYKTGLFLCKGEYESMPFEMRLFVRDTILVAVSAHGAHSKPCFDLIKDMKFYY